MSNFRLCYYCGNGFNRPYGLSAKQWSKRCFCSLKCSGKFERVSRLTAFERNFREGPSDKCWEWTGSRWSNGYGRFCRPRYSIAHRVSWELYCGEIPDGMNVLHRCDNPCCVNPSHLFLGTDLDNMRDKVAKERSARGEQHGRAFLTEDAVRRIRDDHQAQRKIATEYGVSQSTVSRIKHGEQWGWLP